MTSRAAYLVLPAFAILSAACADKAANRVAVQPPPPETVFVKQPEPAPPPAPPLAVSPRTLAFNAIGDTARLAMPAGAECVAASDGIARIDSSGLITAAGNGDTHLRCWLGEQNASVKVSVAQQLARVSVVADEGLSLRKSGDSLHLNLARVDRLGTPVESARPVWTSLTPEVVRVDATTGTVVGVSDTGTARVVGVADQLADTVIVEVGAKAVSQQLQSTRNTSSSLSRARALARARTRAAPVPGEVASQALTTMTPQQSQGPGGVGARNPEPGDSLFRQPDQGLTTNAPITIVPSISAGFAEYRTIGAGGLEKTSGAVYGLRFGFLTRGLLSFRIDLLTGTLAKDTTTVIKDRKFMSGGLTGSIAIAPWLNIVAGVDARRFEDVTVQRWMMVHAGGEANFQLGGGPLRGIARLELMPLISIASDAGSVTNPSFGIASALGIGYENRRISSSIVYDIERFTFPSNTGRKEQFGALLFRFGIKFGT